MRRIVFEDGESTLECGYSLSFKENPVEELYLGREFSNRISPFKDNTNIVILSLGRFTKNAKSIFPESNENLRFIYCYNPIPSEVNNFTKMQYVNIIVNIPTGSFKAYKSHSVWGLFWNLEEPYIESDLEIKAQDIILNIEEVELYVGETVQLQASVLPDNTTDKTITWSSSNELVANVSEEGLVTAISGGIATITASCGEISADCAISVLEDAGIENLFANPDSRISIFTADGILIKKDCNVEDLKSLPKGIYIIVSGKESYKISI